MNKEFTCPDCGYTWQHGQHGGHSCATVMKKKIEDQEREIERLQLTCNDIDDQNDRIYAELAALKAQPSGVFIPHGLLMRVLEPVTSEQYINAKHELLELMRLNQPASGGDDAFCDGHCTWLDHHPDCVRATVKQSLTVGDDAERAEFERETIRAVFLRNGFTIKEGQTDLKPYVYAAATELMSIARAALPVREAVAEGWRLVPVEMTRQMIDAANSARGWVESDSLARGCYRAMLAAAPSPSREGE